MPSNGDSDRIPVEALAEDYFATLHNAYGEMRATFARLHREEGLTQETIARRLGVNKSLVSRRLHGQANLTLRIMSGLATAMNCELRISFHPFKDLTATAPVPRHSTHASVSSEKPSTIASKVFKHEPEVTAIDAGTSVTLRREPILSQESTTSVGTTSQSHRVGTPPLKLVAA